MAGRASKTRRFLRQGCDCPRIHSPEVEIGESCRCRNPSRQKRFDDRPGNGLIFYRPLKH
jgi:hypothetical protein